MQIYLVGGAVRDQLLGLSIQEKDWVVVGATVEEMLQKGFRPVGKDFPVFLHPQTHEEYALARTERKTGRGYTGFQFNASPEVTLEEDLLRRDLTINAMAQDNAGNLIDPFHGKEDLEKKLLRHVSHAFVEDPVRILRVARFAARYSYLGFHVVSETLELMRQMVQSGEVDALVAERVWKEWERALTEQNPEVFFEVLSACNAASVLFPALKLEGLIKAAGLSQDSQIRFAALLTNLTKVEIDRLCMRYRVPSSYRELAMLCARDAANAQTESDFLSTNYIEWYARVMQLSAVDIVNLLQAVDAFRREERFNKFLKVCEAVSAVLYPHLFQDSIKSMSGISQRDFLIRCYVAAKHVDVPALIQTGFTGKALAEQIKMKRIEKVSGILRGHVSR